MHNEFTAIIERDGEWFIGYCPEIPGANGQGRTVEEFVPGSFRQKAHGTPNVPWLPQTTADASLRSV